MRLRPAISKPTVLRLSLVSSFHQKVLGSGPLPPDLDRTLQVLSPSGSRRHSWQWQSKNPPVAVFANAAIAAIEARAISLARSWRDVTITPDLSAAFIATR